MARIKQHEPGVIGLPLFSHRASQLSEHIQSDLHYDMLRNDYQRIHAGIQRIGAQESIERVRILNKSGEIMYSSESSDIGKMVDRHAESCFGCHQEGKPLEHLDMPDRTRTFRRDDESPRLLGIIDPILNEESCWSAACHAHPASQTVLGVLDVTIPLTEADRNIRNSQLAIIVFAVSAILLLGLVVGKLVGVYGFSVGAIKMRLAQMPALLSATGMAS